MGFLLNILRTILYGLLFAAMFVLPVVLLLGAYVLFWTWWLGPWAAMAATFGPIFLGLFWLAGREMSD